MILGKDKNKKTGIGKQIREIFKESSVNCAQISISNTGEALIEGCVGILEYGSDSIRIASGKGSVRFCGDCLRVRCLNPGAAIISGDISAIEFYK